MKQHGALFTTENRLAIREDRKTMTRRIPASFKEINEKPYRWEFTSIDGHLAFFRQDNVDLPFRIPWAVGDELYIKEPHYLYGQWDSKICNKRNGDIYEKWFFISFKDMGVKYLDNPPEDILRGHNGIGWFLRSPLFLSKEHARDWLRVTDNKVERLQSISEIDAVAEGTGAIGQAIIKSEEFGARMPGAVYQYAKLWNSINGKKHPWERNEWDVAYTFERIRR